MAERLDALSLSELKEMAKEKGLKGISSLRKAELVGLLSQAEGGGEAPANAQSEGRSRQQRAEGAAVKNDGPVRLGAAAKASGEEKPEIPAKASGAERSEVPAQAGGAEKPDAPIRSNGQGRTENMGRREGAPSRRDGANPRQGSRADGRNIRVVNRYGNSQGYQGRGHGQDQSRNQDSGGRGQDMGRSQEGGSRGQDLSRGQENGSRSQDLSRGQENGSRSQDMNRGQESGSRSQENGERGQNAMRGQEPAGRGAAPQVRDGGRPEGRNLDLNQEEIQELDSGMEANGILEVMPDGFGFIRCENFLPGENDVYVAPSQIRRFNMKTGDIIRGNRRVKAATEKFAALLYVTSINGYPANVAERRRNFEDLTPIFPNERIHMETPGIRNSMAMRVLDLMAPIGKGQRGMIVSPPKAGKTTLLKQVARAITTNQPQMHLIILLIDERPEEVTDMKEAIVGKNVEVIYSTFDELPERHKRVSEMVIERARRLVEHGRDVTILLDSITRLARAYNLVVPPSGRTLSGGLDPAALHMPKRFFGAARNMREGGSLTILATALIDTGSRMDDVIYEEFKGTGNMELVLDRKLSEKRIFPAIDILRSGTRRDDLLLSREETEAMEIIRRATNSSKQEDTIEKILDLFSKTRSNREFVDEIRRRRYV